MEIILYFEIIARSIRWGQAKALLQPDSLAALPAIRRKGRNFVTLSVLSGIPCKRFDRKVKTHETAQDNIPPALADGVCEFMDLEVIELDLVSIQSAA